jgi:outer membrane protein TolC
LGAQAPAQAPRQLSLQQAIDLARQNSPSYRQTLNDAGPAAMAVKESRAALFPTVGAGGGLGYSGAGRSTFGGTTFNQSSPTISSNYSISASWGISVSKFLAPSISKASERATQENIASAGVNLVSDVTGQYLAVLRASATTEVARQQVIRNTEFLNLARARQQAGAANALDVQQATVTKANADVQLLQALQGESEAKIELLRRMGIAAGEDVDSMRLTESFALAEPNFSLDQLKSMAHGANPALKAAEAQHDAASISVRAARSDRLPSFSISTGFSGYTQQFTDNGILLSNALRSAQGTQANCEFQNGILSRLTSPHPAPNGGIIADCNAYAGLDASGAALQPSIADAITRNNSVFPFNFTKQPWSIRLGIDLPVWDGFSRSLRISQARAQEDDAREGLRAQQLTIDGNIQSRLIEVRTAYRAAMIQDTNRTAAREQLRLAQEKYRIGNGSALEVADAQNAVTQAEATYVQALYGYHLAVVGLEAAVGRPLR